MGQSELSEKAQFHMVTIVTIEPYRMICLIIEPKRKNWKGYNMMYLIFIINNKHNSKDDRR